MKRFARLWPLAAVLLAVAFSWGSYETRSTRVLDVVVVDKTVPFRTYIEHRSLFWALRAVGVTRADGLPYDIPIDYLGAYPAAIPGDPPERTAELTGARALRADLVYLADTYGVYRDDLSSKEEMKAALERSPKVYGGLTPDEAEAVRKATRAGVTLVAEFNTLGSPTVAAARGILEEVLGVRWTRWRGRFFSDLSDREEVPQWMRRIYEHEWKKPWEFAGPGYVLVEEDSRCEVLRTGEEAKRIGLTIEREAPPDPLLSRAADGVPYPYWFDIVIPDDATQRLARFQWHVTPAGSDRLRARGLPESFPAVTRRVVQDAGPAYYFAGDFADNPMPDHEVPFAGYTTWMRWLHGAALAPSEMAFYWRFYYPTMERLLHDVPKRAG